MTDSILLFQNLDFRKSCQMQYQGLFVESFLEHKRVSAHHTNWKAKNLKIGICLWVSAKVVWRKILKHSRGQALRHYTIFKFLKIFVFAKCRGLGFTEIFGIGVFKKMSLRNLAVPKKNSYGGLLLFCKLWSSPGKQEGLSENVPKGGSIQRLLRRLTKKSQQ